MIFAIARDRGDKDRSSNWIICKVTKFNECYAYEKGVYLN